MDKRLLGLYGFLGPLIGIGFLSVLGLVQLGYTHLTDAISTLGAVGSPSALIMNWVVFPLIGSSVIALGLGLHYGIKPSKSSFIGPLFLLVSGFSLVLISLFPCDPGCVNKSIMGRVHVFITGMTFLSMVLAQVILYLRLRNDKRWKGYEYYSLITALTTFAFLAIYRLSSDSPIEGLLERIAMLVPFIWVEVMAVKLMKLK